MMQPWQRSEPYQYSAGTAPLLPEEPSRGDLYALSGRALVDLWSKAETGIKGGHHKDSNRTMPSEAARVALRQRIIAAGITMASLSSLLGLAGRSGVANRLSGRYGWAPGDWERVNAFVDSKMEGP